MAKLILSMDGLVLKEIALTKERTTIGRKPHNDIQIDNLAVSGEHAVIVTILQDSFLEDLGSTNGTVVNGQPVKKHFLQNNDIIELGKYKLKYVNEAVAGQAKAADFEKTKVLPPGSMKAPTPARAPRAGRARGKKLKRRRRRPKCDGRTGRSPQAGSRASKKCGAAASLRGQRRQGARSHQAAHDTRQARRPSGRHHAPAPGLFHHPCRGGKLSGGERQASRRPGALFERP